MISNKTKETKIQKTAMNERYIREKKVWQIYFQQCQDEKCSVQSDQMTSVRDMK